MSESPSPTAAESEAATPADVLTLTREAAKEFITTGDLSGARYTAFANAGIPRVIVDAHIDGLLARMELRERQAYDAAGGQDQFEAMTQWAIANLPNKEIDEIAAIFASGNMEATLAQIETLRNRYVSANNAGAV